MSLTRPQILSLYRELLRNARVFPSIKRKELYNNIILGEREGGGEGAGGCLQCHI